jgi:hypothetical protein
VPLLVRGEAAELLPDRVHPPSLTAAADESGREAGEQEHEAEVRCEAERSEEWVA